MISIRHLPLTRTVLSSLRTVGIRTNHSYNGIGNQHTPVVPSTTNFETATRGNVGSDSDSFDPWSKSLYPRNMDKIADNQHARSARPKIDPRLTTVLLFPGQGMQYVGMGEKIIDSPNVNEMFEIAKKILGYDLLDICMNGPQSTLDTTEYCQPAMFVTSLGAVEKLRAENPSAVEHCVATAGFSVCEFAALVFAGVLSFENALRLVKLRAEAMQAASDLVSSGLMRVIYGADGRISYACKAATEYCVRKGIDPEHAVCSISNYLFPHCKVVGGHVQALQFLEDNKKDFGLKNCRRLPVSGAFHRKLMKPAEKVFAEALKKEQINPPLIPVYSNIDARAYRSEQHVLDKLPKQISQSVKFQQIIHTIYGRSVEEYFPFSFECGAGTSMKTILDKNNLKAGKQTVSIQA